MLLLSNILVIIKRSDRIVEVAIFSKETMGDFIIGFVIFELISKSVGVESWVVDFRELDDGGEDGFYEETLGLMELFY
jgi:hypothetical protein